MGIFAIHEADNNYHIHFLLNPINISDNKRKFHNISPKDYQSIQNNWNRFLNIFALHDGVETNKYKQRSWGDFYKTRKFDIKNKRYNLEMRDKFVSEFFNPVLKFLNENCNTKFKSLEKKKYRKNNKYAYFQTSDLFKTITKIKEKWSEIQWALAVKKLNSNGVIEFFNSILDIADNNKIQKSFPTIFNNFQNDFKNIDSLFSEYNCFQKQLKCYQDIYEIKTLER
jgi:hypothetical protein